MIAYQIGTPAEHLIALRIKQDGTVVPSIRRRLGDGAMADVADGRYRATRVIDSIDFEVAVEPDHSGVVEIVPAQRNSGRARTVIPLGIKPPFLRSEMPPSPGADGSFSFSERVAFRLAGAELTWRTENMSGRAELGESLPELSVVLRLPTGNRGAISFPTPLAVRADGRVENVVAVT